MSGFAVQSAYYSRKGYIVDYQSAIKKLAAAKNQAKGKPIANNTHLHSFHTSDSPAASGKAKPSIGIRLHSTDVVVFHPNGDVTFDSGGWQTVTTKARMNEFGPSGIYISQVKGIWYLIVGQGSLNATRYLFVDGMTIKTSGKVVGPGGKAIAPYNPGLPSREEAKIKALRKSVDKYSKAFVEALYAGKVDAPSNGDCWHCLMRVSSPAVDAGKTLGEATSDKDHILSHIQESYFVPSLLYRAAEVMGVSMYGKHTIASLTRKIDDQGQPIQELKDKAGSSKAEKMYIDNVVHNKTYHCGYIVARRWFSIYQPVQVEV